MPRAYTLERAAYEQCRLRMQGYLAARFLHQRDRQGRPTGRFVIEPGEHVDLPARLLRQREMNDATS